MKQLHLICALLGVSFAIFAKPPIVLNKTYNGTSMSLFIQEMEKQYDVRFFLDTSVVKDIVIKQKKDSASVETILRNSFEGSDLSFVIDPMNNIVITKDYELSGSPPVYFYEVKDNTEEKDEDKFSSFLVEKPKKPRANYNKTLIIGDPADKHIGNEAVLSGSVVENETGDPIIGAIIWIEDTEQGTTTDFNGYYFIEVPKGKHKIEIRSIGRETANQEIVIHGDGKMDLALNESVTQLADVTIMAGKLKNVQGLQMGLDKVEIKTIKQLPAALGEVDVIKAALMLPGVQTVGEGASGFNVRGGATDQNLILFDQAPVFNSSHLFGFFSAFNPDVLKDFSLYKSAIPAEYGDRISSVFDITSTNGGKSKFGVNAGLSPVSGKIMIDGPIIKNKTSILLAGRSTYSDWLLKKIDNAEFNKSSASFYDLNLKLKHSINKKNSVQLSLYNSNDDFRLNTDTVYNYKNFIGSVNYKYIFNDHFYTNIYLINSNYQYAIESKENLMSLKYKINYNELKTKFNLQTNAVHKMSFGGGVIDYNISPSKKEAMSGDANFIEKDIENEKALEPSAYFEDEIRVTENFSTSIGLRLNSFIVRGPRTVYSYIEDLPKEPDRIQDSTIYSQGDIIKTYFGAEPRINARYTINENNSIKASYNRLTQYIHMLSNSTAVSPTDMWKLSDYHLKPVVGDMFSIGYYRDLKNHVIETSIELYYKLSHNIIEYKGGAELFDNPLLETDLLSGEGRSYGVEFLVKKKFGYFNGWVAYTYSRSEMKFNGKYEEEKINNGEYFPTNYDKPHDLTIVLNNKFSRRLSLSNTVTYSTGRPITYPVAAYKFNGNTLMHYSERNEYRIPDYFRWDVAINIEGNLKSKKIAHSSWTIAVYNVTGRDNVYSEYFKADSEGRVRGYRLSIFANPIPTITYNIKF